MEKDPASSNIHPIHQHSLTVGIPGSSSYPMGDAAKTCWLLRLLPPPGNPYL